MKRALRAQLSALPEYLTMEGNVLIDRRPEEVGLITGGLGDCLSHKVSVASTEGGLEVRVMTTLPQAFSDHTRMEKYIAKLREKVKPYQVRQREPALCVAPCVEVSHRWTVPTPESLGEYFLSEAGREVNEREQRKAMSVAIEVIAHHYALVTELLNGNTEEAKKSNWELVRPWLEKAQWL